MAAPQDSFIIPMLSAVQIWFSHQPSQSPWFAFSCEILSHFL